MNEESQTHQESFSDGPLFRKRIVKTYSPSHITGFFEICDNKNPLYKGSIGCGIVLEAGCVTEVSLGNNLPVKAQIKINGRAEEANTTKYVVEHLTGTSEAMVVVSTNFEVPVGCGFGASGAGALSTALALNELLSLNMTVNEVAQITHCAEVENSTGLGDVIAETYGGVVIRKKPGPPGIGVIDRIPHRNEKISYVAFGKKSTKSVLTEGGEEMKRRINEAGRAAMKALMRKPTLETFMRASREFSLQSELISDTCKDAIEAVDAEGKVASVAMLGETVFVVGNSEALREFGVAKESRISDAIVRII
ncbi:MAG: pantoate kinase [Candidatus Methanospirareceae archaeon]